VSVVTYPDRPAWLEARKSVLTATQAAILWTSHCGGKVWPGSTPWDVWAEKVGEKEDEDLEGNLHIWLGRAMERPICEWVAGEVGLELQYPEPYTIWTSDTLPFMAATPDAFLTGDGKASLLEAKTAGWADEWGDSGGVVVPGNYLAQVTWQMAVCDIDACYLGVYLAYAVEGFKRPKVVKDRRWYLLQRIHVVEQMMVEVCWKWWQTYVETGFPPPRENKIRKVA
jgi:putative phage-type endonuclease